MFTFLGLTKENPKFQSYLSSVHVLLGGSVDFQGAQRTFSGPAVPAAELAVIEPIAVLFNDALLDSLPRDLRDWLGTKIHWSFQRVIPVFMASPLARDKVITGNLLIVGSQYYNSAGDLFTEICSPLLRMMQQGQGMIIKVDRGVRKGDIFEIREGQYDDLAIVEKVYDKTTKSTVLFASGLGVVGTIGAVFYIVENWQQLQQDFGNGPFAICLRFQNLDKDPYAYRKPIELARMIP